LEEERKDEAKNARQPPQSGLYWGNYNAVCSAYQRARQTALARGGELKFRRHDGSGRLVNQIQGGMNVATLFAGVHSQVKVVPRPPRRERARFSARRRGIS
jgi:hypothetical protein